MPTALFRKSNLLRYMVRISSFCIVTFQLYGNHPFDRLLEQTFHHIVGTGGIKLLGKLLGDGTATAGILLHQDTALHYGTRRGVGVNARMFGKTYIFRSYQGVNDIGRQIIVSHKHAVFLTIGISTQYFSVLGKRLLWQICNSDFPGLPPEAYSLSSPWLWKRI